MALPTLTDLKRFVRRTDTTDEDALLTGMLAQATAIVEAYIDLPIAAREIVAVDEDSTVPCYALLFPYYPIDEAEDITVQDADGTTVDPTAYRVDVRKGLFRRTPGNVFANGPYTIIATAGWSADPTYATLIEPVLSAAILDVAAGLYFQRNAGASTEAAGSGIMTVYGLRTVPPRVESSLQPFRRRWIA